MFHPRGPTLWELAVQAFSSTERGYDLLAPKFEYTPFCTPAEILEKVGPFVGEAGDALDVCCGTGAGMRMLRPWCRRVVGVDFSRGMLAEGARLAGNAALEFVRGDALDLPFEGESFDVVTSFAAFGHILRRDEGRLVSEVRRVLRPGGRFIFLTIKRPPVWSLTYLAAAAFNVLIGLRNRLWSPPFIMYYLTFMVPEVRALLERGGFQVAVTEGLYAPEHPYLALVVATRR